MNKRADSGFGRAVRLYRSAANRKKCISNYGNQMWVSSGQKTANTRPKTITIPATDCFELRSIDMFSKNVEYRWKKMVKLFHTRRDLEGKRAVLSTLLQVQE